MKIGFSFGRCVASIVRGEVDENDVLCLIARTHMPAKEDVEWVIDQYMDEPSYLKGLDRDRCIEVGVRLFETGKILEPRANGIGAVRVPKAYIWMDLFPTIGDTQSDSVKDAWNTYRMLLQLTELVPELNADAVRQQKH